jgi:hypothetical protein
LPVTGFVAKKMVSIPLELREAPRVLTLHMGYNLLSRIDNSFYR